MNWSQGAFPSLQRRGGRAINKKAPFRNGADGVVAYKPRCRMRFETWCVSNHPVCAFQRRLRGILLMAQPPLLLEEGNKFLEFIHTLENRHS